MTAPARDLSAEELADAQRDFTEALPVIDRVLRARFTYIHGERKGEALAEGRALAWANYLQLVRDGRDPKPLIKMMAKFAGLAVRSAARLTGQSPVHDVMSPPRNTVTATASSRSATLRMTS